MKIYVVLLISPLLAPLWPSLSAAQLAALLCRVGFLLCYALLCKDRYHSLHLCSRTAIHHCAVDHPHHVSTRRLLLDFRPIRIQLHPSSCLHVRIAPVTIPLLIHLGAFVSLSQPPCAGCDPLVLVWKTRRHEMIFLEFTTVLVLLYSIDPFRRERSFTCFQRLHHGSSSPLDLVGLVHPQNCLFSTQHTLHWIPLRHVSWDTCFASAPSKVFKHFMFHFSMLSRRLFLIHFLFSHSGSSGCSSSAFLMLSVLLYPLPPPELLVLGATPVLLELNAGAALLPLEHKRHCHMAATARARRCWCIFFHLASSFWFVSFVSRIIFTLLVLRQYWNRPTTHCAQQTAHRTHTLPFYLVLKQYDSFSARWMSHWWMRQAGFNTTTTTRIKTITHNNTTHAHHHTPHWSDAHTTLTFNQHCSSDTLILSETQHHYLQQDQDHFIESGMRSACQHDLSHGNISQNMDLAKARAIAPPRCSAWPLPLRCAAGWCSCCCCSCSGCLRGTLEQKSHSD